MNQTIDLKAPATLTLQPQTVALILDTLALHVPYARAKPIIEQEIWPQLMPKPEPAPAPAAEPAPADAAPEPEGQPG